MALRQRTRIKRNVNPRVAQCDGVASTPEQSSGLNNKVVLQHEMLLSPQEYKKSTNGAFLVLRRGLEPRAKRQDSNKMQRIAWTQ